MSLERLLSAMRAAGIEADAKELADALWLAARIAAAEHADPAPLPAVSAPMPPAMQPDHSVEEADDAAALSQEDEREPSPSLPMYLPGQTDEAMSGRDVVRMRAPAVSVLPRRLEFLRALRPLRRRVESAREVIVDEVASADRIADEGIVLPVLRPAQSRWLSLALVVDAGPSMAIWNEAIHELRKLFEQLGAFRDVRVWYLHTAGDRTVGLSPAIGAATPLRSVRELVDPGGRHAVAVLSDCVDGKWYDGSADAALEYWGRKGPLAILQTLPERLWDRSGAVPMPVRMHATRSGLPNSQLLLTSNAAGDSLAPGVPVPLLELEPAWLAAWARLVAGTAVGGVDGVVTMVSAGRTRVPPGSPEARMPLEQVMRFRASASPEAFLLAGYLATLPLSLPVMRLAQHVMMPASRPFHLAEIFVSGLLRRTSDGAGYDFMPGVRDVLLSTVRRSDAIEVIDGLSAFVSARLGQSPDFAALLGVPQGKGQTTPEVSATPFAVVPAEVLRRLGGAYARFVPEHQALEDSPESADAQANDLSSPALQPSEIAEPAQPEQREPFAVSDVVELLRRSDPRLRLSSIWGREIPFRNRYFVGRDRELNLLRTRFTQTSQQVTELPAQAITGMGGIGKTEIATEYAHRHRDDYDVVWWIRAEQEESILHALWALGKAMGLFHLGSGPHDQLPRHVLMALESLREYESHRKWLLIFDNVMSPSVVSQYMPRGVHVILTSRTYLRDHRVAADTIEVNEFSLKECTHFLRRRVSALAHVSDTRDETQRAEDAVELATLLGNLPLAAEHAAAFLNESGTSVQNYIGQFRKNAHEMMSTEVEIAYPLSVSATWRMSSAAVSPEAQEFFGLLACFSAEPIREEVLVQPAVVQMLPETLQSVLGGTSSFRRAARELARHSLIKIDGVRNVVQLHRVVQAVTRDRLKREDPERAQQFRDAAHLLLAASDPDDPDNEENFLLYELSMQHIVPSGGIESDKPRMRRLIVNQVRRLQLYGGIQAGLELGEAALNRWHALFGRDDPYCLALSRELAACLILLGENRRAAGLITDVLTRLAHTQGRDHETYLLTARLDSSLRRQHGEYDKVYQDDLELLSSYERIFLPTGLETIDVVSDIALDLRCLGRYEEALRFAQRAFEERRRVLGPTADHLLGPRSSLALDLRALGRYEEALDHIRTVCDIARRKQASHPQQLQWECDLAVTLRCAGFYAEARQLSESCFKRHVTRLGREHRQTLACAVGLAHARLLDDDVHQAVALGEDMLLRWKKVTGNPAHPNVQAAAVGLALARRRLGDPVMALSLNQAAAQALTAVLGLGHPATASALTNQASDLAAMGNVEEAQNLGERAVDAFTTTLGPLHPRTLAATANLVLDQRKAGNQAEALYEQTRTRYDQVLPHHPHALLFEKGGRIDLELDPLWP